MKKTTQFLLLGASSLLFTACDRPQNTAKIRIQLPSQSKDAKPSPVAKRSGKVSAQGGGGSDWGQPIPNSINDFNCYAVFIGGPEADMRDKACIKGSGSSFEKFYFHNMVGFRPAGQTIEVDVKPGAGRKFYVLGVKSNINGCQSLENPDNIDQSQHSNPLVVGTKTADLVAGNNSITIDASLDTDISSQLLQGCSFFGGTGGAPDRIDLRGPISSYDGSPSSALGWSTCNRVRLELRSQDGDPLLDSPLSVSLNVSSSFGTVGAFHSNENCSSSEITSTSISPGEYFKDVFFKASPTYGTGAVSISAVVGAGTIHAHRNIDIGYASYATNIQFMDSELRLAANTCADVFYWPVAGNRSAVDTSGTINLSVFNLASGSQNLSSLPGSAFLDHCAGSPISGVGPTGHTGKFSFRMGSLAQDFQIGSQTSPQALMQVNVEPKAHHLHISAADMSPYASECTEITVQARTAANTPADLSGNDLSPFSLIKRIRAQIYPLNPNSARGYYNDACTIDKTDSNTTILEANNSSISEFYTFSTTGTAAIRVWGGEFLSGNNESFLMMTPRWDPGVITANAPGTSYSYFKTPSSLGGVMTSKNYFGPLVQLTPTNSPTVNLNSIGTGNHSVALTANQSLTNPSMWGHSNLTFGILLKPVSYVVSSNLLKILSTSGDVASLSSGPVPDGLLRMLIRNAGNEDFIESSLPLTPGTWQALIVIRNASMGTCSLYLNGYSIGTKACDNTEDITSIQVGSDSSGLPSEIGELFLVEKALSPSEISQYMTYLQTRYPNANLNDYTPNTIAFSSFDDLSSVQTVEGISVATKLLLTTETVSGTPFVEYQLNGGAWTHLPNNSDTEINITNGKTLQFRVDGSTGSQSDISIKNISFGTMPILLAPKFRGTVADPCAVNPTPGENCVGGSIYLGLYSGSHYMTTPGNCTDSSSPTCNGGTDAVQKSWQGVGGSLTDIPVVSNITDLATPSNQSGSDVTTAISSSVGTNSAAAYCENMTYGGFSDWFLPTKTELAFLYCVAAVSSHNTANPAEAPDCAGLTGGKMGIPLGVSGTFYWAATEYNTSQALTLDMIDGDWMVSGKTSTASVRCLRKF